jgi:hypothetical protein
MRVGPWPSTTCERGDAPWDGGVWVLSVPELLDCARRRADRRQIHLHSDLARHAFSPEVGLLWGIRGIHGENVDRCASWQSDGGPAADLDQCAQHGHIFGGAVCIWRRRSTQSRSRPEAVPSALGAVSISFFTMFLSEWADFGQISAAALVLKYNAPGPIWLGDSLALCSKGALALTLGLSLRRRVPERLARALSVSSCLILALTSLYPLITPQSQGRLPPVPRTLAPTATLLRRD